MNFLRKFSESAAAVSLQTKKRPESPSFQGAASSNIQLPKISSLIQTILSVPEFHRFSHVVMGRGLSPPVGNCTPPRRIILFTKAIITLSGSYFKRILYGIPAVGNPLLHRFHTNFQSFCNTSVSALFRFYLRIAIPFHGKIYGLLCNLQFLAHVGPGCDISQRHAQSSVKFRRVLSIRNGGNQLRIIGNILVNFLPYSVRTSLLLYFLRSDILPEADSSP